MVGKEVVTTEEARVASYMAMPYTRMLIPDPEEGGFIAEVLELPGCITAGSTPVEAYRNLEDALAGYIAVELDRGHTIPNPVGMKEYSGRFPLRMSSDLHREAAIRALNEGISLNQWIGQAIAERLAKVSLADELVVRIRELTVSRTTSINIIQHEVASNRGKTLWGEIAPMVQEMLQERKGA